MVKRTVRSGYPRVWPGNRTRTRGRGFLLNLPLSRSGCVPFLARGGMHLSDALVAVLHPPRPRCWAGIQPPGPVQNCYSSLMDPRRKWKTPKPFIFDRTERSKLLAKNYWSRRPTQLKIMQALQEGPGTIQELALDLQISISTVAHALNRLQKAGLVETYMWMLHPTCDISAHVFRPMKSVLIPPRV